MVKEKRIHLPRDQRMQVIRSTHRLLTVESRQFESDSRPGKHYTVRIEVDGRVFCTCQGWTIKKAGKPRQCKHAEKLIGKRRTRTDGEFLVVINDGGTA